jgi:anti-anti-sigma factor
MNTFPGDEREVFEVTVRFDPGSVVAGARGEVNLVTAADLNAIMVTVADSGRQGVILDLSACTFMGAEAMRIMPSCAAALARSGGRLVVRSASSLVERLIDMVGVTDMDIEPPHFSPSDACTMMRRCAVGSGQPLASVAVEVVASTQGPLPVEEPGPRG